MLDRDVYFALVCPSRVAPAEVTLNLNKLKLQLSTDREPKRDVRAASDATGIDTTLLIRHPNTRRRARRQRNPNTWSQIECEHANT